MTVVINGTSGITDVNGSAAAPAITGTDTDTGVFFGTNTVSLSTGGTERLQIDSSGNAGLGVTPSSWDSTYKAIQVGARSMYYGIGTETNMNNNAYYNSGWKYVANAAAGIYSLDANSHKWYIAPSGTAGNAISFTQAMTLDASGNLAVNTTSPLNPANKNFTVNGGSTDAAVVLSVADTRIGQLYAASGSEVRLSAVTSVPLTFRTADTERARITSSGQVFVGLTSSINGTCTYQQATDVANNQVQTIRNTSTTSPYIAYWDYPNTTPNNAGSYFLQCNDATANRFQFRSNGGIANYSANNSNLSDRREKTNFSPAGEYLAKICAIPVQTFNYIDQNLEEDGGLTLGVVAQDVQAVAPELVMESNWGTKDEPKMRLSIYQTDLQYALMKCIQEQQAIIEQLQADVAALKGQV